MIEKTLIKIEWIRGAGHNSNTDDPEQINKSVRVSNNSRHAKLIYKYAIAKDWWNGPHADDSAKNELGVDFSVKTTKKALVEYMNQIYTQRRSLPKRAHNDSSPAGFCTDRSVDVIGIEGVLWSFI